jgi:hypothetical protein
MSEFRCQVPWDRRPDESGKAYRAFKAYLSLPLGKRTLIKAYKELKKVDKSLRSTYPPDWSRWKKIYDWDDRVAQYDSVINGERLDMLRAARNEAFDELSGLLLTAVRALSDLLTDEATPHRVKADAIFQLFELVHLTGSGLGDKRKDQDVIDAASNQSQITVFLPENDRLKK